MEQPKASIPTAWYNGVKTQEQKDDIKTILLNDKIILDKLSKIVYNMVIKSTRVNKADYSDSSWAYKQAHINGELEALRKILALIDIHNDYQEHKGS